jgi:hypothetical protein
VILDKLEEAMEPDKQLSNVFGRKQEDGKIKGGLFMPTRRCEQYGADRHRDYQIQF